MCNVHTMIRLVCSLVALGCGPLAHSGEADVIEATAECDGRVCSFIVTLKHADSGWDHYADRWNVLAPDGRVLGSRVLYHPHVNEQPFTRTLNNVEIPAGIAEVIIQASDKVHGTGGRTLTLKVP